MIGNRSDVQCRYHYYQILRQMRGYIGPIMYSAAIAPKPRQQKTTQRSNRSDAENADESHFEPAVPKRVTLRPIDEFLQHFQ
jgi:hypothetical protein